VRDNDRHPSIHYNKWGEKTGMDDLSEYCPPGVTWKEEMIPVSENVSLRVITFTPAVENANPAVVFVAGWISLIAGWKKVLREMTKDFPVYYIETREKISAQVRGRAEYSAEAIGRDIVTLISHFRLTDENYILFGSSLGATAILDCCRFLKQRPLCLVLIGPNAEFRVPGWGMTVIRISYPLMYNIIKPFVKSYLKTFRLDVKSDYAQYEKYCNSLDAADPSKLKKAAISLSKYLVWNLLENIAFPTLIVGASKDKLHEPENLKRMVSMMKRATLLDLKTNASTHSEVVVEEIRKYIGKL